ncbi:16S rRNA (cytosine(1402)-N(4))-methyltransferase [Candidatus Kaiserbacteria bacterium RIFCSPHIGHO2_02_FULL_50_9]|uniref:Ribosomal RNA small subunit methyltransferase H n=1 Tax=Candidatus Kaiserbacteria bacterium RIFCSPLOWO2_01_FULL_51_21 TaxID=1798508 RepID=A0A1F6EE36_9BACT|nr:MAG: 16S rRNA (cytosine(1402)-N(4))-methyltransferase [Candidatus Kaiserbacteria bacterium RIFCSPHIGHO2_01_FULL_51_33]OGG63220.1 MAG: 16S rRNA (cytosine(1402)-N(4))-methyltransferase [Candidatus Kaiserbacteria bacterium RIFCSPHIGHO2_02_FULL_50_9]OGG71877.1 MAG: 16S rRNA (cytosine(1402)-N(4))-methyltransferase [Candidatus Kaiserbacteria bacterium RIFCSPLOWO2_01_FULL_51_21]
MHTPVLLQEVALGLALREGDTVVDATVNGGGHAEMIAKAIGETGVLVGFDLDRDALSMARKRLEGAPCKVVLVESNFTEAGAKLKAQGITGVDKFLFDLGLSSNQLDPQSGGIGRGFSFRRDEPLIMTFKTEGGAEGRKNAAEIVNSMSERELADMLWTYGQERASRKIAKAIVAARAKQRILTTEELVSVIERVAPRRGRIHPATKTFQALRIFVNDELENLKLGLGEARKALRAGGRIAVISFHSLEDKIVKEIFKTWQEEGGGAVITKKPIIPTREEAQRNPRSRSAKLRIFEKQI